jgi:pimeloyl-ACP methyl ester carboxylesterase
MKFQYIPNKKATHTILFLHGWCCEPEDFINQIKYFKGNYSILLPDYTNLIMEKNVFKKSEKSEKYKYFKYCIKKIAECIQENNLNKIIIVGHSMGGAIALFLSSILKSKIISLVIIDTTMPVPPSKSFTELISKLELESGEETLNAIIQNKMINQNYDNLEKMKTKKKQMIEVWKQNPKRFTELLNESCKIDKIDALKKLTIPTMYIGGEPSFGDIESIKKTNNIIITKTIQSGHFIMLNKHQALNKLLENFIKTNK